MTTAAPFLRAIRAREGAVHVVSSVLPLPKPTAVDRDGRTLAIVEVTTRTDECPSVVLTYPPETAEVHWKGECVDLECVETTTTHAPEIIVTTLALWEDFERYGEEYVAHYSALGVDLFLVYVHGPVPDDPPHPHPNVRLIEWDVGEYWTDEERVIHRAQSSHLAHATLLAEGVGAPRGWLFSFDLDEHATSDLRECVRQVPEGCRAVAIRSRWVNDQGKKAMYAFEYPQRSKFGQRLDLSREIHRARHRGIHRPSSCAGEVCVKDPAEIVLHHHIARSGKPRPLVLFV